MKKELELLFKQARDLGVEAQSIVEKLETELDTMSEDNEDRDDVEAVRDYVQEAAHALSNV